MKIAYITLHWPRTTTSSIGKKIMRQTKEWRANGHTVRFFSHLHPINDKQELVAGKRFYYPINQGLIKRELGRAAAARDLIRSVSAFKPDLIYLRWGMYTMPMQKLFSIAPVIVEINTNDKKEHRHLGLLLNMYNRLTRSFLLKRTAGLIFTSNELANDPAFTRFKTKYKIISNGIDLINVPNLHAPNNQKPRLIFIGTPGMTWHGINELIRFAKINSDIEIDLVGFNPSDINHKKFPNIHLHGYLKGNGFEDVLKKADVAIGTVSLYLKDMDEASPFKIRDCAGRGIPCILPYFDTDLSNLNTDTILQIPNTPDNLVSHSQVIHNFIFSMRGKRLDRSLIADRIDIAEKEKKRIAFFKEILDENSI